jgi:hypothetical protein
MISSSLCSISLQKRSSFERQEVEKLERELSSFVSPFVNETNLKTDDNIFRISFECNSKALPLLHDYVYCTKAYHDQYSIALDFQGIS